MNGYPQQTRGIDFLVGDEAFDFCGALVSPKPNLPIRYKNIDIDWVSLGPSESPIFRELVVEASPGEVPVMGTAPLVAMKLLAGRQRDKADVVELIEAGADLDEVRAFFDRRLPAKKNLLEKLIRMAAEE